MAANALQPTAEPALHLCNRRPDETAPRGRGRHLKIEWRGERRAVVQAIIRNEETLKSLQAPQHLAEKGITIEYDVVACDDFVLEQGRWGKMMPRGTLLDAGFDPDFVPT